MNDMSNCSEEIVNAFVDGELAADERQELLAAAAESDQLRQRICEAVQLKEMVRAAYPLKEPATTPRRGRDNYRRPGWSAMAAGLGAVTLAATLLLQEWEPADRMAAVIQTPVQLQDAGYEQPESRTRVVFHVSSADPEAARELLDQVELVLREYAESNRPLKVEVIANNQGLRLLQQGRSPVAERIRQLDERYQNLMFAACGNTLERLRRETGEPIRILPQAVIVQSGVSFVARRQREGWAYIKV